MKLTTWLIRLLVVSVFVLCMLVQLRDMPTNVNRLDCRYVSPHIPLPNKPQLATFIVKALHTIQDDQRPLCVLEVGTADGTGTTASLFDALQTDCIRSHRKGFRLHTYEVDSRAAEKAREAWKTGSCDTNSGCVEVVNEMVLDERVIDQYIMQQIEGPDSASYPGKDFYRKFYSDLSRCIGTSDCGSLFHTVPRCTLDLVLIDSTRFSHAGIMQTILQTPGLAQPSTVFVVEDDFWSTESARGGSESWIIRQFWNLTDVETAHPVGEQWPWILFKVEWPKTVAR